MSSPGVPESPSFSGRGRQLAPETATPMLVKRGPVQNVTPAAVFCPTVGAKCCGMDICLSIGLCVGAADTAGGICRRDWAQT